MLLHSWYSQSIVLILSVFLATFKSEVVAAAIAVEVEVATVAAAAALVEALAEEAVVLGSGAVPASLFSFPVAASL